MPTHANLIHNGEWFAIFQMTEGPFSRQHLPQHNAKAENITFFRVIVGLDNLNDNPCSIYSLTLRVRQTSGDI